MVPSPNAASRLISEFQGQGLCLASGA
ncbi:unnamed protein product, partial [Vitis vinifera]